MDIYNDDIYLTKGEANVTHVFYAIDGRGQKPDLSSPGWSGKIFAGKKGQANVLNGAAVTILADQVNYRGGFSFMFTAAFIAATAIGQYEMSVVLEHTDGRKIEYPKYPNEQFGTLHIQRSKAA